MADESDPFEPQTEQLPEPVSEPVSATERLRAFEDAHFGESHPRHAGQVEKGSGSLFSRNDENWGAAHRAHHAALEALIAAEAEHQKASTAEAAAHAKLEAAVKRASATEEAL